MQTAGRALGALLAAATLMAQQRVGEAEFDRWMRELSNWGKWGKSDQKGTANLITPAKVREAAAQVKEGFAVSLSRDADLVKSEDNRAPFGRAMISTGADPKALFAMDTYTTS